jgi:hypothetical protein
MITIDKLENNIEKLTEKIKGLTFPFNDPGLESDAEKLRDAAVEALEDFLELANTDWENGQKDNADEGD